MLHVLLLQLPVPNNPATNTPLALGYLKAYAHAQGLLRHATVEILPRALADSAGDAMLVDAIVERAPDVLGMSLYTWNSERSLGIALRAKQRLPSLTVLVGGPEVQRDNTWVLEHPAVDIAAIGEGEQTFAALLRLWAGLPGNNGHAPGGASEDWGASHEASATALAPAPTAAFSQTVALLPTAPAARSLANIPGLAFRDADGTLRFTDERVALADLAAVPSPYLLGLLEFRPGDMLMVEVSRWCPYACSFCLYGRNMGTKLGNRYFGLDRVLAEIGWGRAHGASSVHFIEANLNLVPLFRPLMDALAEINADGNLALYAELRGEHLREETVALLAKAGLHVAEVGLQTANPAALLAAHRRTDLAKWAAGTRRLYEHGVEVLLDVILGLPEDDEQGVAETLAFIEREELGAYDAFTLQMLPATATRADAERYGMVYQDRPPYYVLGTDRMPYATLRRLRRELKERAGLDPDAVEGCPAPRTDALALRTQAPERPIDHLWLSKVGEEGWKRAASHIRRLAAHVDVVADWATPETPFGALLAAMISANPATLFDVYLRAAEPPAPAALSSWRDALPYLPGYLDRVAVYGRAHPAPAHRQVSPRLWLVLPWHAQADPDAYAGIAGVIWAYPLAAHEQAPLGAWRGAGGAGIWVPGTSPDRAAAWSAATGATIWHAAHATATPAART